MGHTDNINFDFVLANGLTLGEAMKQTSVPKTEPLFPSCPGETLGELMEEGRISVRKCARRCGLAEDTVLGVLEGWLQIDDKIAAGLARGFKLSETFWLNREHDYEESLAYHSQKRPPAPMSENLISARTPVAH